MTKTYISLLFFVLLFLTAQSQQIHRCLTTEYVDHIESQTPGTKENMQSLFHQAKAYAINHYNLKSTQASNDTIFRIPVVFHVVYNLAEENTSDALLESQIRVLNEDFRRMGPDTINTRAIFKDRAADVGFEFFFATIDPDGNPTTGITRTFTTKSSFSGPFPDLTSLDEVKKNATEGEDAWNTSEYLNIWVCNTGGSILGYAYPPEEAPNWSAGNTPADQTVWGVVISHQVIGYNNPLASGPLSIADGGKTGTHEIGHFFGLRHIWGDSGFFGSTDCDITKDDGIDDTPHMGNNSQQTGCDFTKNTCTNSESPDEPDMPENFMDYSTDACQNIFTEGQSAIMRSMAVIARPDLVKIIQDETLTLQIGEWIVINGTDTIQVNSSTIINLEIGDEIMFLTANNGVNYISTYTGMLSVTDEFDLSEDKTFSVKDKTAINELTNPNRFNIFPNPTNSILNIETEFSFTKIRITNINGQTIKTIENTSNNKFEINDLKNGIYIISIYQEDQFIGLKKMSVLK